MHIPNMSKWRTELLKIKEEIKKGQRSEKNDKE